jgi:hypothetical protein
MQVLFITESYGILNWDHVMCSASDEYCCIGFDLLACLKAKHLLTSNLGKIQAVVMARSYYLNKDATNCWLRNSGQIKTGSVECVSQRSL